MCEDDKNHYMCWMDAGDCCKQSSGTWYSPLCTECLCKATGKRYPWSFYGSDPGSDIWAVATVPGHLMCHWLEQYTRATHEWESFPAMFAFRCSYGFPQEGIDESLFQEEDPKDWCLNHQKLVTTQWDPPNRFLAGNPGPFRDWENKSPFWTI